MRATPRPEEDRLLAVHYASRETRRSQVFAGYDVYGEPDGPISMHYFFYVVRLDGDLIVIDTGFSAAAAARRGYTPHCLLPEALSVLEIDPATVRTLVLTHLHFDHTGYVSLFTGAEILLQRAEWEFWQKDGHRGQFEWLSEPTDIDAVAAAIQDGRVRLLDGDHAVNDRMSLLLTPGHTPGQQIIDLRLGRRMILASDAAHYYEELEWDRPFSATTSLEAAYHSFDRLRELSNEPGVELVAGHDPEVSSRWKRDSGWGSPQIFEIG